MTNQQKVEEIMEVANDVLNGWEIDFMENISDADDVEKLSEKQQKKLDQIYDKVCASPF